MTAELPDTVRHKSAGGRPTREKAIALADTILDAAWDIILTSGYTDLTIDRLARVAGVSKRTIYSRFASREDVIQAVMLRVIRRWSTDHREHFVGEAKGDWLLLLVSSMFDMMVSPEGRALSAFMTSDGFKIPNLAEMRRTIQRERLLDLYEQLHNLLPGFPEAESGVHLAGTVQAHVRGWAEVWKAVPDGDLRMLKARISNEVQQLLIFYGCSIPNAEAAPKPPKWDEGFSHETPAPSQLASH